MIRAALKHGRRAVGQADATRKRPPCASTGCGGLSYGAAAFSRTRHRPHLVLCQEISAAAPGGLRVHLWTTANTLGMIPLLGLPAPGGGGGAHPAILVAASAGLVILDADPAWPSGTSIQPAWCEALVQVPGWAYPLRAYSVDLPAHSSTEQRSQADHLASCVAGLGELAVAGGNWNSCSRADAITAAALEVTPLHLRPARMRYTRRTGP